MNQSLETYLQHYVNEKQNNWVTLLPMAQLALNNRESDTTKATPFYANFGKHLKFFSIPYNSPNADGALWMVDNLKKVHDEIWENIKKQQDRTQKYQNEKQKEGPQLKKENKVYLLTKNLKTWKLSKKLDHVRVGSFFIKTVKGPVNYELDLPQCYSSTFLGYKSKAGEE
jgi:hypothetical protein